MKITKIKFPDTNKSVMQQEDQFTTAFCNKKTSFLTSFFVLCALFMQMGLIMGFFQALEAILQSYKITYKQQSLLSTISWPFFLKIAIAPFIDSYFSKNIGKCKTYILIGGIVNSLCLLVLHSKIEYYFEDLNIFGLWTQIFTIAVFVAFTHVAVDAWMLTIFEESKKSYGGYASYLGQVLGFFIGYSLFVL